MGVHAALVLVCLRVHCQSLTGKHPNFTFRAAGITIITSLPYLCTANNPALFGEGSVFLQVSPLLPGWVMPLGVWELSGSQLALFLGGIYIRSQIFIAAEGGLLELIIYRV